MAEKYCTVVTNGSGKELYRSKPMEIEKALDKAKAFNKSSKDTTWNACNAYIETALSVKHLPVKEF